MSKVNLKGLVAVPGQAQAAAVRPMAPTVTQVPEPVAEAPARPENPVATPFVRHEVEALTEIARGQEAELPAAPVAATAGIGAPVRRTGKPGRPRSLPGDEECVQLGAKITLQGKRRLDLLSTFSRRSKSALIEEGIRLVQEKYGIVIDEAMLK